MSTSKSSSAIEKQMVPENELVQQDELLTGVEDSYGGIVLHFEKPMDSEVFTSLLRASISQWKQQVSNQFKLSVPSA